MYVCSTTSSEHLQRQHRRRTLHQLAVGPRATGGAGARAARWRRAAALFSAALARQRLLHKRRHIGGRDGDAAPLPTRRRRRRRRLKVKVREEIEHIGSGAHPLCLTTDVVGDEDELRMCGTAAAIVMAAVSSSAGCTTGRGNEVRRVLGSNRTSSGGFGKS